MGLGNLDHLGTAYAVQLVGLAGMFSIALPSCLQVEEFGHRVDTLALVQTFRRCIWESVMRITLLFLRQALVSQVRRGLQLQIQWEFP